MQDQKSFLFRFAAWWENHPFQFEHSPNWRRVLPTTGNALFTLLIAGLLILTQQAWANDAQNVLTSVGPSATTINYQGRLADPSGNPQDGTFGMSFAIWDSVTGGSIVWGPESHDAVAVTDGLFNIGLGSKISGGVPPSVWNGDRYLEITVDGETLSPRELIRSVPIAGMALTVPTGAIKAEHITPTVFETYLTQETPVDGTAKEILSLDLDFPVAATYMIIVRVNSIYTDGSVGANKRVSSRLLDELGNEIPGSSIHTHHSEIGRSGTHTGSITTFYNLGPGAHKISLLTGASGYGTGAVRNAHIIAVPFHQANQP